MNDSQHSQCTTRILIEDSRSKIRNCKVHQTGTTEASHHCFSPRPSKQGFQRPPENTTRENTAALRQLREQIRAVETENRRDDGTLIKHGCEALDRLLPEGGYSRGTLIQWISAGGQGAEYLSLRVAQQACLSGGALVIADPCRQFFPPAAAALGIDLNHLIILQTADEKELLWGLDQALRCPAVGAVWGWLDVIEERQFRRFQLSAESSGAMGLFLQPYTAARQPSWAEVQWLVGMGTLESSSAQVRRACPDLSNNDASLDWEPSPATSKKAMDWGDSRSVSNNARSCGDSRSASKKAWNLRIVSLQLTRCRGTHTGKSIRLTIDPLTGAIEPLSRSLRPVENTRLTSAARQKLTTQETRASDLRMIHRA